MKDIINKEIRTDFNNWSLFDEFNKGSLYSEWGEYGYGYGDENGSGDKYYGDVTGNGSSKIR